MDPLGGGIAVLVEVEHIEPRLDVVGDDVAVSKGGSSRKERKDSNEELGIILVRSQEQSWNKRQGCCRTVSAFNG